jgi:hypothetical protein
MVYCFGQSKVSRCVKYVVQAGFKFCRWISLKCAGKIYRIYLSVFPHKEGFFAEYSSYLYFLQTLNLYTVV